MTSFIAQKFLVWYSPICLFLLFFPLSEAQIKKNNIAKISVKEHIAKESYM